MNSSCLQKFVFRIKFISQDYEDYLVESNVGRVKNKGRETALKESLKEDLTKEFEGYSFEDDPGSNNSGYYELQAGLFSRSNLA